MRLAAVVVTYNRLNYLKKAIQSTLAESVDLLVVVDNCSTDGTREWLYGLSDERVKLVLPDANVGGAGGFKLGFKAALELQHEPDWIVCFDDDAYPETGALDRFKETPPDSDSAAAAVFYPDGRICEMNRPSWNPFWHPKKLFQALLVLLKGQAREQFHIPHAAYYENRTIQVDASSFVGCFIKSAYVRQIGLPRGDLFIYGDDIIYTLMATKAGGKHLFLPHIRFVHDCQTFQNNEDVYKPLWKAYYTYRNGLLMYRLAAGRWYSLVFVLKICIWLGKVRKYDNKRLYLKLVYFALKDGIRRKTDRPHSQIRKLF